MRFQFDLRRLFALVLAIALALALYRVYGRYDLEWFQTIFVIVVAILPVAVLGVTLRYSAETDFLMPLVLTAVGVVIVDGICNPAYYLYRSPLLGILIWSLTGSAIGASAFYSCRWKAPGGAILGFLIQFFFTLTWPVIQS